MTEQTGSPIKIIGGTSLPQEISLQSDRFVATARFHLGKITTTVKPRPAMTQVIPERYKPFIPRTFAFFLFLLLGLPGAARIVFLAVIALQEFLLFALGPLSTHLDLSVLLIAGGSYACCVVSVRSVIGPWHGAEHKVIAAYLKDGKTDLDSIRRQSRIDPQCGARLFIPLLSAFYLAGFIQPWVGINHGWIHLLLIELYLQLDHFVGLDRIPPFKQFSYLLQKYVTTCEPGDAPLATAQAALLALLKAHELSPKT